MNKYHFSFEFKASFEYCCMTISIIRVLHFINPFFHVVKKETAVPLLLPKKKNVSSLKSFVKEPLVKRDLPRAYYDGVPFWQYVVSCFSPNRA